MTVWMAESDYTFWTDGTGGEGREHHRFDGEEQKKS